MPRYSLIAATIVCLAGTAMSNAIAADSATIELGTEGPLKSGDRVEVEVSTGTLPSGARLVLSSESGAILGAVAPFPPGGSSTTVTVPVPRSAIVDGRLQLRLQISEPGAPPRAPRPGEVKDTQLRVVPQSD